MRMLDPIEKAYAHQKDVWTQGEICWGWLVQANEALFSPEDKPYPADVIYSRSLQIDANPNLLGEVARSLYGLKHTQGTNEDVRRFVDIITNEVERTFDLKIPQLTSGPPDMYFTSFLFDPRHLPENRLLNSLFPVMRCRTYKATLLIPHWYWPDDFKRYWTGG